MDVRDVKQAVEFESADARQRFLQRFTAGAIGAALALAKMEATMNFCSECGHRVVVKIPPEDSRPRFVCEHCLTIHYQNPKVISG